jgi:hypothetical protein
VVRWRTHPAERNPPIEEVIKTGVIPKFVEFLQRQEAPQLQVCGHAGDVIISMAWNGKALGAPLGARLQAQVFPRSV